MAFSDKSFKYSSCYTSALFLLLLGITILNHNSSKITIVCQEYQEESTNFSQGNIHENNMSRVCRSNKFISQQNMEALQYLGFTDEVHYTNNTIYNSTGGSGLQTVYQFYHGSYYNYFLLLIPFFALTFWSWMDIIRKHIDWPTDFTCVCVHNMEQLAIKYILRRHRGGDFNDILPIKFIGHKIVLLCIQLLSMKFLLKVTGHTSIWSYARDALAYVFIIKTKLSCPMEFSFSMHKAQCEFNYFDGPNGELVLEYILCQLPCNNLNSWIFLFAWFWITFGTIVNVLSILSLILMSHSEVHPDSILIFLWKLKSNLVKDFSYGEKFMIYLLEQNLEAKILGQFLRHYTIQRQFYPEELN